MRRVLALALVPLALAGCSVAIVTGPQAPAPVYAPGCRTSCVAPVLDATASLAAITGAGVAAISYHECTDDRCGPRAGLAATSLLAGLVLAASAAYGYSTAHLCRDAEAAHAEYERVTARRSWRRIR